jgi:hypothetical protein
LCCWTARRTLGEKHAVSSCCCQLGGNRSSGLSLARFQLLTVGSLHDYNSCRHACAAVRRVMKGEYGERQAARIMAEVLRTVAQVPSAAATVDVLLLCV